VIGFDLAPDALTAARAHARAARVPVTVGRADAGALPLADSSVDAVATNLPWGRTAPPASLLRAGLEPLRAELARILRPAGRAVILAPPELPDVDERIAVRVAGARATIVVLDAPAVSRACDRRARRRRRTS
jgi:SAM-dependent methyltransferase